MPMSSRKLSASIFTVGCLWTKALMASADAIMMPTAMMTAAIMTQSSSTMPTAVMTESSEKTMSSSMIWMMTLANDAATFRRAVPLLPFELVVDLVGALAEQEEAAADQDQIAAGESPARW